MDKATVLRTSDSVNGESLAARRDHYLSRGLFSSDSVDQQTECTIQRDDITQNSRASQFVEGEGALPHRTLPEAAHFKPVAAPTGWPILDFRPIVLQTPIICTILAINLLCIAMLAFLLRTGNELHQWTTSDSNTYFMVHFLPSIIGTVTTLALRAVFEALVRITPYMRLAANHQKYQDFLQDGNATHKGQVWTCAQTFGASYFTPYTSPGSPFLGFIGGSGLRRRIRSVILLMTFVTPLKSGLLGAAPVDNGWLITVKPIFAYILIAVYCVSVITLGCVLSILLRQPTTGLKWDPTSIADQVALFYNSTAMEEFQKVEETIPMLAEKTLRISPHSYALGYWEDQQGIFYGIRQMPKRLGLPLTETPKLGRNEEHLPDISSAPKEQELDELDRLGRHLDAATSTHPDRPAGLAQRRTFPFQRELHMNETQVPEDLGVQPAAELNELEVDDSPSIAHSGQIRATSSLFTSPQPSENGIVDDEDSTLEHRRSPQYHSPHWPYTSHSPYERAGVIFYLLLILVALGLLSSLIYRGEVNHKFTINNFRWAVGKNGNSTIVTSTNITAEAGDMFQSIGEFRFDQAHNLAIWVFLFRTIPVQAAGNFAVGHLSNVDLGARFGQAFTSMHGHGGTADETILLDYVYMLPGLVTIRALRNKHWKVMWFSALALTGTTFPILVGALYNITNLGAVIEFEVQRTTFWLVYFYLVVSLVSLLFAFPTRKRSLPRYMFSIADIMSLSHASYYANNPSFDVSDPRITKEWMQNDIRMKLDDTYQLGIFEGVDNRVHFGIDVVNLKEEGQEAALRHVFEVKEEGSELNWVSKAKRPMWGLHFFSRRKRVPHRIDTLQHRRE